MTLLAAIPSFSIARGSGFVMSADSQETVIELDENGQSYEIRRTVQKIAPLEIGDVQVVIAGGGNADLIKGFIEKIRRKLPNSQVTAVATFLNFVEVELLDFYQTDVNVAQDKNFSMIIAFAYPMTGQFGAWLQQNVTLVPITEPTLEGWRHNLYVKILERICSGGRRLTPEQATLAAIYVLGIAESTSNYVRGPMSVVVVNSQGIRPVQQQYIDDVASRLRDYDEKINTVFLGCADITKSVPDLEDVIEDFKKSAVSLHRDHIDRQAAKLNLSDLLDQHAPLQSLPGLVTFSVDGKLTVEHDRQKITEARETWKELNKLVQSLPRIVRCKNPNCYKDFTVKNAAPGLSTVTVNCPHCDTPNEIKQIEWNITI